MEKSIKYNMPVQCKKCIFLKQNPINIKQSTVFFFSMNDSFLGLWINTPRPNWEIHIDWENDVCHHEIRPG